MANQKFYREPWTKERVDFLEKWWPHFGTHEVAIELAISRSSVKAKADKLGLKMLPKQERLCSKCREDFQFDRNCGAWCRKCHLAKRKSQRLSKRPSLEEWIRASVNTARYRSHTECDLTCDFMVELWQNQSGKCFYSGMTMLMPSPGEGRSMYSASIDRLNPELGYTTDNVVWACWICNAGKNQLTIEDYVKVCESVVQHHRAGTSQ